MHVAIDIGGTFTDAVAIDDNGVIKTAKASTTHDNLTVGAVNSLKALKINFDQVSSFVHGTTAGLNALLERKGGKVALITTKGFKDIYEIGRANRPEIYNFKYKRQKTLLSRSDIFEIDERIGPDGSIIKSIKKEEITNLLKESIKNKYNSIAVCLLHSYKNPEHEEEIYTTINNEISDIPVILSSHVSPEWREYERTSTTVVSAYTSPIIIKYLTNLQKSLKTQGINVPILIMQSNGGVVSAEFAKKNPVQTLLSGPVGGTIAGVKIFNEIKDLSKNGLICMDMGGTSFDVSIVIDGEAQIELDSNIDGHDLLSPSVAIHTIGAGGGSITDFKSGKINVGPRSAGSNPGPVCYNNGGTELTVTDADLVIGRISKKLSFGNNIKLDYENTSLKMKALGEKLNLSEHKIAEGIIKIADGNMANAVRELTVFRGLDPRDYALMAFGGAGPLHTVALAEELEISTVIIPANAGVLSAWGMLQADYRVDKSISFSGLIGQLNNKYVREELDQLSVKCKSTLALSSENNNVHEYNFSADLRYLGQEYTLTIPIGSLKNDWQLRLRNDFDRAYLIRFGHCNEEETVELVNLRVTLVILKNKKKKSYKNTVKDNTIFKYEKFWSSDKWQDLAVCNYEEIKLGASYEGPLMVTDNNCTSYVPRNWKLNLHKQGHMILRKIKNS
jgi:N-methylhydantoinase A